MKDHIQAQYRRRSIHRVDVTKTSAGRFIGNWPDPMRKGGI